MFDLYADHPHMVAIESSASFLDKLIAVRNAIAGMLAPEPTDAWTTAKSPLFSISGDAVETSVGVAPISSLMGLASVGHVLPVMD
jgi:hypothetical protein